MSKKRIAVLFGGVSSEHEVSRMSAVCVLRHLSQEKYDVVRIGITKKGRWFMYTGDLESIMDGSWEKDPSNRPAFISPDSSVKGIVVTTEGHYEIIKLDVVIPALHGKNGEDGTIQGLLQLAGIPFVGCDATASAACMDKVITNIIMEHAGIAQAKFTWLYAYDFEKNPEQCVLKVEQDMGAYPVFVKPANAGSSVGVSKAANREELTKAIRTAAKEDKKILIEENVVGQEVECAVLGNDDALTASIPGEIAPSNDFYDYDAKYVNGTSSLYIPAHIGEEIADQLRAQAIKAYSIMGCSGLARVDFFVRNENEVLLNELNTLPGFTSISMYPKLMEAIGVPVAQLLDRLVELAIERK